MTPNFLVIGAEKSGTTWLYHQLKRHPNIYLPETKEVHFFNELNSNLKPRKNYQRGLKWYEEFFKTNKGEDAIGEVTPMYLCDDQALHRILSTIPDCKFIAILRNPVNRAYSHYWMARNKGHVKEEFNLLVSAHDKRFIERGLYGQQLSKYLEKVRSEDLLILIYEEVFDAPEYWLQKIAEFLEVDTEWFSSANNVNNEKIFGSTSYRSKFLFNLLASLVKTLRSNRFTGKLVSFFKRKGIAGKIKSLNAKSAKYPQMDVQMKAELESYYKQDIKLLESILKRKIPSWEVN